MTDEVTNLRQILAQTQIVERSQEQARRRGDVQQQHLGRRLLDRVEIQGQQVEESPSAEPVHPDQEQAPREDGQRRPPRAPQDERPRPAPEDHEAEESGQQVDLQA